MDLKQQAEQALASSQAVAVRTKAETTREYVMSVLAPQMGDVLQKRITPERFMRIVLNAFRTTPKLMECSQTSLGAALMNAAALGLEPNTPLGQAYLIPFDSRDGMQVQFIIGYKGLLDLARRSGQIVTIHADVVRAQDEYHAWHGSEAYLKHVPYRSGERGDVVTYYAYARLKDGGFQFVEMTPTDVEAIRERSKAKNYGPWKTDYEAMAKKTVLRQLCKLLPQSIELGYAMEADEHEPLEEVAE